jgi:hypothetical protein
MQPKTEKITPAFAPETEVEIKIKSQHRAFDIPELLVLPLAELPIRASLNPMERRGIPSSAINDQCM